MSESGGGGGVLYTYQLEVTQTAVNVPYIDGDNRPTDDTGNTVLYSIYTAVPFTIDLQFTLYEIDVATSIRTALPIGDLDYELIGGYTGVTFTLLDTLPLENPRVRVSGSLTGGSVNISETYRFVLDQENYPEVTTTPQQIPNDFLAIVEWIAPSIPNGYFLISPNQLTGEYLFTANSYINPSIANDTLSMTQYVYWNFSPALAAFKQLVNQGKV